MQNWIITVTLEKQDQSITFNPVSDQTEGDTFTLDAATNSALAVEFTIVSGPATISGNEITLTGPGQVTIRASQPGNADFNPAEDVEQTFCANPQKPTVSTPVEGFVTVVLSSSTDEGNQWFSGGNPIPGETSKTVSVMESGIYSVQVTVNGCVSELSEDQEVVITPGVH